MSSSESRETKVVQTELDPELYERLQRVAKQEGTSLKEAVREAIVAYVRGYLRFDRDDPLFDVAPGTGDRETDARAIDEYLAEALDDRE